MCAAFEFQPTIETKIHFDTDVNSWLCPKDIIDCIFFVFKVSVFSQRFFNEKKKEPTKNLNGDFKFLKNSFLSPQKW